MTLKILHIVQSVNPKNGGPIEGIRQQALEHTKFGHQTEVASLDPPKSTFLDFPGTIVYPLKLNFFDKVFPVSLYLWLSSNKGGYDAIIINGIWGFHLYSTWLAIINTNVPYFVFIHGMLDPWFRRMFPLKHLKKWLIWPWAIYPALRDADAVFFTCRKEKVLARESFWLYDCNETVIKYGTAGVPNPLHDYTPSFMEQHPELNGKEIYLFLGRVHPKKGPDILIKAVANLQRAGYWSSSDKILVMAGPRDNLYAEELNSLAQKLGVFDSIYWTGMISGEQKWGAFQAADAFVLPSHQENFGISVAEALSCGIPVLISKSVNIADDIEKYGAGLVDNDDVEGTFQLLKRWFDLEPKAKGEMRSRARSCFKDNYHITETSRSITKNIYLSILERKRLRP